MISKYILPWFGGGPAIWTTSQAFFQVLLLGGYAYAHAFSRMSLKTQTRLHITSMALVFIWLVVMGLQWGTPVTPSASWKPEASAFPAGQVLLVLLVSVGLPYFLLSTTSSLLQSWFSRMYKLESPYSFYILSNAASLFALLSYPVLFEPVLTLHQQGMFWSIGFGVFLMALGFTALQAMRCAPQSDLAVVAEPVADRRKGESPIVEGKKPDWKTYFLWINLAGCGTVMSLATTNQMTQDVASVPFLWVLPLSLYLLSFIVGFNDRVARSQGLKSIFLILALAVGLVIIVSPGTLPLWVQIVANSFVLFVVCLFCHSELYRRRPDPKYLTSFYLMLSVGGALGGILVSFIAPLFFKGFWEFPLGLLFCADLIVSMSYEVKSSGLYRLRIPLTVVTLVLAIFIVLMPLEMMSSALEVERNFYGVVRVRQMDFGGVAAYTLVNGSIVHGMEAVENAQDYLYSSYYTPTSGAGLAFNNFPKRLAGQPLRAGVIGLGVGTLAEYGKAGDTIRFYEIDPKVISIAHDTRYFTYLRDSQAKVEIVEGDARLSMERELKESGSEKYDIFIVDAFSGDSIPTHLLDKEAIELYLQHLNPGGVMAFHISNKYLNLEPVLWRISDTLGLKGIYVLGTANGPLDFPSFWVMLSRDDTVLKDPKVALMTRALQGPPGFRLWTDDYSNLFQVIR